MSKDEGPKRGPTVKVFESHVSSRGQIVIPKAIRDQADLSEGCVVTFHITDDGDIVMRRRSDPGITLDGFAGAWEGRMDTIERMHRVLARKALETAPASDSD